MQITPQPWTEEALCQQVVGEFFEDRPGKWTTTLDAKKICKRCPVREECLEYAVTVPLIGWDGQKAYVEGVWGATTTKERARMRTDRGITRIPLNKWPTAENRLENTKNEEIPQQNDSESHHES